MNIVMVTSWFETRKHPGMGSFFLEQAKAIQRADNKVIIIAINFLNRCDIDNRKEIFERREYIKEGIKIYSCNMFGWGIKHFPKLYTSFFRVFLDRIISKIEKKMHIDILHVQSFYPAGTPTIRNGKSRRIPVVVTEHASLATSTTLPSIKKKDLTNVVSKSDSFICVSNYLKDRVVEITQIKDKCIVIPNVVNPIFRFAPLNQVEKFVFLLIGRIEPIKQYDLVIEAFSKFNSISKSELWIVGEGSMKEQLVKTVKKKNISEKVKFLGQKNREEIPDIIAQSNALLVTSKIETFSIVTIESFAIGRPVISFSNGGPEELINQTNGIITKTNDVAGIVEAMNYLILNYNKYNLKKISQDCISRYSYDSFASEISHIYSELLNKDEL